MPAHAFDTLKAMRTLTDAGMHEPVAEAVVTTMNDAVTEGVAAKADIVDLKAELKADIAALKARLDTQQWVLGFIAAMALLLVGRNFGAF